MLFAELPNADQQSEVGLPSRSGSNRLRQLRVVFLKSIKLLL